MAAIRNAGLRLQDLKQRVEREAGAAQARKAQFESEVEAFRAGAGDLSDEDRATLERVEATIRAIDPDSPDTMPAAPEAPAQAPAGGPPSPVPVSGESPGAAELQGEAPPADTQAEQSEQAERDRGEGEHDEDDEG